MDAARASFGDHFRATGTHEEVPLLPSPNSVLVLPLCMRRLEVSVLMLQASSAQLLNASTEAVQELTGLNRRLLHEAGLEGDFRLSGRQSNATGSGQAPKM